MPVPQETALPPANKVQPLCGFVLDSAGTVPHGVGMENEITVQTTRGSVRFHSVGNAIAGIPAKYVKVRFTGKAGETAGIVIEATKAKSMSISDLSRLFPYSESGKMSKVHTSPEFASWDEAFAFSFN